MALSITGDEVRYRLRKLNATDISNDALASGGYIPAAQSTVNLLLADISTTYDSLSTDKQNIAKALAILLCCQEVIGEAPTDDWTHGPVSKKHVSSADKETLYSTLQKKINDYKNLLGLRSGATFQITTTDPDSMVPDYENTKNIDYSDTADAFDRWS